MSVAQFRSRPLGATRRDRRLWVEPAEALARILRAAELGFNTLVTAAPGGGVTTLLNQVAARLEGRVAVVPAAPAQGADELLDLVSAALEEVEARARSQDLQAAVERLALVARQRSSATVVLDSLRGDLGHQLFGRMREELWELGLHWLVGTSDDEAATLMTPPADAFFETVVRLGDLSEPQVVELLARRDPQRELEPPLLERIAARSQGNPALALALARQALVVEPERRADLFARDPVEDVRERLGDPAARLYADLIRSGPSGPWDTGLLQRMGWSRPRAYQVFQALEGDGFVRSRPERTGAAGRPRKIYEVMSR